MFKKFFGKKNDGFFMQLEDEAASSIPEAKAKAESAPTAPVAVVKEAIPVAPPTTTEVVATTVSAAAPVSLSTPAPGSAPAAAPATGKVDKKGDKKADKKAAKKIETPPVPVVTAPAAPPITNFATDYLIKPSSSSSRRMPGANMRGFLDLARQVEKPKAFKANAADRKSSAE